MAAFFLDAGFGLLRAWVSMETHVNFMDQEPIPALKLFEFRDGSVTGQTSPEDAENFSRDFQGLRHFAQKMGDVLDLGDVWMGSFREADFTLLWSCSLDGQSGQGAMIEKHAPMFELLQNVTDEA